MQYSFYWLESRRVFNRRVFNFLKIHKQKCFYLVVWAAFLWTAEQQKKTALLFFSCLNSRTAEQQNSTYSIVWTAEQKKRTKQHLVFFENTKVFSKKQPEEKRRGAVQRRGAACFKNSEKRRGVLLFCCLFQEFRKEKRCCSDVLLFGCSVLLFRKEKRREEVLFCCSAVLLFCCSAVLLFREEGLFSSAVLLFREKKIREEHRNEGKIREDILCCENTFVLVTWCFQSYT